MDVATNKIECMVQEEMQSAGIGADLMEFVLYKVIQGLSKEKTGVYGTEIVIQSAREDTGNDQKYVEKTGTPEEMIEDLKNNNVNVTIKEGE